MAEDLITVVRDEQKSPDPVRLINETRTKLETVTDLIPKVKSNEERLKVKDALNSIQKLLTKLMKQLGAID